MQIIQRHPPAGGGSNFVPRLVREPLDIVRQVAGELDDGGAETRLGLEPRSREAGVDEIADNTCHYGINVFLGHTAIPEGDKTRLYFAADALHGIVQRAPLGRLIRGGISLSDLFG